MHRLDTILGFAVVDGAWSGVLNEGGRRFRERLMMDGFRMPEGYVDAACEHREFFGTSANGSLRLFRDHYGLRFEADIAPDRAGRRLHDRLLDLQFQNHPVQCSVVLHAFDDEWRAGIGGLDERTVTAWSVSEISLIGGDAAYRSTRCWLASQPIPNCAAFAARIYHAPPPAPAPAPRRAAPSPKVARYRGQKFAIKPVAELEREVAEIKRQMPQILAAARRAREQAQLRKLTAPVPPSRRR